MPLGLLASLAWVPLYLSPRGSSGSDQPITPDPSDPSPLQPLVNEASMEQARPTGEGRGVYT